MRFLYYVSTGSAFFFNLVPHSLFSKFFNSFATTIHILNAKPRPMIKHVNVFTKQNFKKKFNMQVFHSIFQAWTPLTILSVRVNIFLYCYSFPVRFYPRILEHPYSSAVVIKDVWELQYPLTNSNNWFSYTISYFADISVNRDCFFNCFSSLFRILFS